MKVFGNIDQTLVVLPTKKAKRHRHPERDLHRACAEWLDAALPPEAFWWPTPNASKRTKAQAANMKRAREMKPGIPDIFVCHRGRLIAIELKSAKGRLSEVQKDIRLKLIIAGAIYSVVQSLDELQAQLDCIVPLRARLT